MEQLLEFTPDQTLRRSHGGDDSESGSFNSSGGAYFSLPMNNPLHLPIRLDFSEQDDVQRNLNYDNFDTKFEEKKEEELRLTKEKLQLSEDEIERLKMELQATQFRLQDVQTQLQSANLEIKAKEDEIEIERKRAVELEHRTMEVTNGQLHLANQQITMLKANLDTQSTQVLDLQGKIDLYMNSISDHDNQINALKVAQLDAQEKFSLEKTDLQNQILILTEKQSSMEAKLEEWELQGKALEDKLSQSEASKTEMKGLYEKQKAELLGKISQLNIQLDDRSGQVEALKEEIENLKWKCDLIKADRDWMAGEVDTLTAEMGRKDEELREREGQVLDMHIQHSVEARKRKAEMDELRTKVIEMEMEMEWQRDEILAGAEEKREAIRQLCFSLDHYKTGYNQLCKAFVGRKRNAVMAS